MKIIALCGAKGSGKDHFYKTLATKYIHEDIRKVAFADPIREQVQHIFGLANEREYDQFKRTTITWQDSRIGGRHVVREIGMLMRAYSINQFTQAAKMKMFMSPTSTWCITDLRFENEIQEIESLGGVIVKIKRVGFEYDGHQSETEIPDHKCNIIIENVTNDIAQYESNILSTYEEIKKSWSNA